MWVQCGKKWACTVKYDKSNMRGVSAPSNPILALTFMSGGVIHDEECVPKATRIIQDRGSGLISCPGTEARENILLLITW